MMAMAGFIMRGHAQVILVAVVAGILSVILPPLGYFGAAALALVTLRKGAYVGALDLALATAVLAAVMPLLLDGDPLFGLWYGLGSWGVLWLLAVILRRSISLSLTLMAAAGIGALIVIGAYAWIADPATWWRDLMQNILTQALQAGAEVPDQDAIKKVMDNAAEIMTALVVAVVLGGYIFGLLLARWWQSLLFNPGGFREEVLKLRLDRVGALVVLSAMIATMINLGGLGAMFTEIVIVLLVVCSIFGVALIHFIVEKRQMNVLWLVGLYVLSIFLMPHVVILTGMLALMDSWMDFRRFVTPPPAGML